MRQRGFTLMEVLISVAILATLAALLYTSFNLMTRGQRDTDRLQERHHTARVAMMRMARELSMAFLSKHFNVDEPRSKTLFLGDRNKITFTCFSHQRRVKGARESDQMVVEYFLKSMPRKKGKGLYRREKTILDDNPERGGRIALMASGVKSIEFEYWDRMEEDWESSWDVTSEDFEVGGALAAATGSRVLPDEITDEDRTLQLPWRVKIHLELVDKTGKEYEFETQTAIHVREPLDFLQSASKGGRAGARGGRGATPRRSPGASPPVGGSGRPGGKR